MSEDQDRELAEFIHQLSVGVGYQPTVAANVLECWGQMDALLGTLATGNTVDGYLIRLTIAAKLLNQVVAGCSDERAHGFVMALTSDLMRHARAKVATPNG